MNFVPADRAMIWHPAPRDDATALAGARTNIVEGRGQQSEKEFARFLRYSISSASELEYHITIGRDIGVISRSDSDSLVDQTVRVRKMLHGLVNRIAEGAPDSKVRRKDQPAVGS